MLSAPIPSPSSARRAVLPRPSGSLKLLDQPPPEANQTFSPGAPGMGGGQAQDPER